MAYNAPNIKAQAQRLPAPSLFMGPPSRNASSHSLLQNANSGQSSNRADLLRQRSARPDRPRLDAGENGESQSAQDQGKGSPTTRRQQQQREQQTQRENDRTDALWAEMQNTLEEVELTAINGSHVFSPAHSQALDELRAAQIALAQAWARTEADEQACEAEKVQVDPDKMNSTSLLAADRKEKLHGDGDDEEDKPGRRERSGTDRTNKTRKSKLEEETENDILLARKRREANDRYFRRVNAGVLDVVAKLEDVAKAMKDVELESKEFWGEKDSLENSFDSGNVK